MKIGATFLQDVNRVLQLAGVEEVFEEELLTSAKSHFGGEHGILYVVESPTGGLAEAASFGKIEGMLTQDMRNFAQYAIDHPGEEDSVVLAPDVSKYEMLTARKSIRRKMAKEVMIIPLYSDSKAYGVLYLGSRTKGKLRIKTLNKKTALQIGNLYGNAFAHHKELLVLKRQVREYIGEGEEDLETDVLIGASQAIQRVKTSVELVASTDVVVTLIGEQGCGKRRLAEIIHHKSERAKKPFNVFTPGEMPEDTLREILIGKKGVPGPGGRARKGLLRLTDGGTLLIEDPEKIPTELQKELLEVMETGKATPQNAKTEYSVDVRIIFSMKSSPKEQFSSRKLLKDLYLKLNVFPILIAPLRDRLEDIPLLVQYYIEHLAGQFGKNISAVDSEVYDYLGAHDWPGNIDELKKEIQVAILRVPDQYGKLNANVMNPKLVGMTRAVSMDPGEGTLKQRIARIEKALVMNSLERNRHNQSATAGELGLSRQALINKLHRYGIKTGRVHKKKLRDMEKRTKGAEEKS